MKRQWIAILMLLVISNDLLANSFVFADYLYRYNTYLEQCENKDNEAMHCNGNCQLAKQITLNEQDNRSEKPELGVSINFTLLYAEVPATFLLASLRTYKIYTAIPSVLEGARSLVFHPPM